MKEPDKTLEKIFEDYNPELNSGADFMEQLNRKLDAVEYIKQRQEAQILRYKYAVLAALVLGVVSGGVLFSLILFVPDSIPVFSFQSILSPLLFIEQNSRMISLIAIASLMSLGIITVLNMVQSLKDDEIDYASKPSGS